jgi:hypothetical protein
MTEEWEKKLVEEFPTFFRDHGGDPRVTCMAFGVCVEKGWFPILFLLCDKIREESAKDSSVDFKFLQIKEKFGTLRIYGSGGNQSIYDLIHKAEEDSAKVCERCGSTEEAEPLPTPTNWIKTHCKACREETRRLWEAKRTGGEKAE